jgi:hypothetical protein
MNDSWKSKKVTPTGTIDWYIKWMASACILLAIAFRAADVSHLIDLVLSSIGVAGWLYVGMIWKDRALIVVNGVALVMLIAGLLGKFFG